MKYLKILLEPIKVKGDPEDLETLQSDIYEKVSTLIEKEELIWRIDDENDDDEDDGN